MLGIQPARGRTFTENDARPGAPCTAIVSHRLWSAQLSSDPAVLRKPVRFSGLTCTVVGVLPADTVFDRAAFDVYTPMAFSAADSRNNGRVLTVWARLAPTVSLESARAEMASLAAAFNADRGEAGRGWTTAVTPLRDVIIGADSRRLASALFVAVALVLLVACLNVAGLSLARTAARRREIAIRTALGASRWRAFRFLMVESMLLAVLGGGAGMLLGGWGLRALTTLAPPVLLPPEATAALDGRALLFTAALSMVTGVFFGTYPAWRGTSTEPVKALIGGERTAGPSRFTSRIHGVLLVAEVALAMVLVVAASALVTSFVRLVRVDPGFYAIRSQAVASRLREMGIRVALGATGRQILTMVLRQGLGQVLLALSIGAGAALWLARLVEPWLFATSLSDPRITAVAAVVLGIAAVAASWMPARRASSVDPLVLLRLD